MNSDDPVHMLWLIGALVLALSALSARRMRFGEFLRALIHWAIIGGAIWAALTHREQVETLVNMAAERLGIGQQEVAGDTVRITMGADGHFWARATLNGVPKRMLIDSGATITALSEDTARDVGIAPSKGGFPVMLTTANGTIAAERATIKHVTVGKLSMDDLNVVVSPSFGDMNVLGMNFLSRLGSWRVEGRTLILEPKRERAAPPKHKRS